jgi:hypothetical protein
MHRRVSLSFVALSMIGCMIALGYWSSMRVHDDRADSASARPAAMSVEPAKLATPAVDATPAVQRAAAESQQPATEDTAGWPQSTSSSEDVARWIADATGADAEKRAAAITALGRAPKSDALPVLRRVVNSGEPEIDRPLALRSLRDLALYQGDEDGGIRTVVREVIYHGDDERMTRAAQDTLDVIEESEMK